MQVPEDFYVSLPAKLGRLLSGWLTSDGPRVTPADLPGLEGSWMRLAGGPLPADVLVRIERSPDGRFLLTGLVLGYRDHREITWSTLRAIRPASLIPMIFAGLGPGTDTDSVMLVPSVEHRAQVRAQAARELWRATTPKSERRAESAHRPRASVAKDLDAFAEVYSRHYAATPDKATKATAEEMHISRATAIRRISECRAIGLLPPKERT